MHEPAGFASNPFQGKGSFLCGEPAENGQTWATSHAAAFPALEPGSDCTVRPPGEGCAGHGGLCGSSAPWEAVWSQGPRAPAMAWLCPAGKLQLCPSAPHRQEGTKRHCWSWSRGPGWLPGVPPVSEDQAFCLRKKSCFPESSAASHTHRPLQSHRPAAQDTRSGEVEAAGTGVVGSCRRPGRAMVNPHEQSPRWGRKCCWVGCELSTPGGRTPNPSSLEIPSVSRQEARHEHPVTATVCVSWV